MANRTEVDSRVAFCMNTLSRVEAAAKLKAANIASGFVNALRDRSTHPALRRVDIRTPNGIASVVAPPVISDGEMPRHGRVPAVGEHGDRIREEFHDKT